MVCFCVCHKCKLFTAMATFLSTVKGEVICEFVESYCCESGDVVYKKPDPGLFVHVYQ